MSRTNHFVNGVILRIKSQLINGVLKPGDKLPSEYDISHDLGISRSTIHCAIRRLTELGILDSFQGKGTYVHPYSPEELRQKLNCVTVKDAFSKIIEFRLMFEPDVCRQLAPYISAEKLDELDRCVDLMLENVDKPEIRAQYDMLFHRTIIEAFRNELITRSFDMICEEIVYNNINFTTPEALSVTARFHRSIVDCMRRRDSDGARSAMEQHLMNNVQAIPVHIDGPIKFASGR